MTRISNYAIVTLWERVCAGIPSFPKAQAVVAGGQLHTAVLNEECK